MVSRWFILFAFLGTVVLTGCAAEPVSERFEFTRVSMGVPVKIVLYAQSRAGAVDAAADAFDRIAQLDDCLSDYRPRSELMRLCEKSHASPSTPIDVSSDVYESLLAAREVSVATGGAFDVSVGSLVRQWREARRSGVIPRPEAIAAARASVGFEAIRLGPEARTVTLGKPGMQLDLGGIGKGYAAQCAAETLAARGHPRCLVALAGDIVAGDPPPGQQGWRIDLPAEVEITGGSGIGKTRAIYLVRAAVSTSGDTQQSIEIDGVRYSHLLDPRTGLGVTSRVMCCVIAPRGEYADAMASALCVLGDVGVDSLHRAFPGIATMIWQVDRPGQPPIISDPDRRIRPAEMNH